MSWHTKREEEEHEECYELAHEEGGGGWGRTWMWRIKRQSEGIGRCKRVLRSGCSQDLNTQAD